MPLLVHAVAWWLLGLMAPWTFVVGMAGGGVLVGWWRGLPRVIRAATILAPLGAMTASVAHRDRQECVDEAHRRLQGGLAVWGVVEASALRGRQPMTLTVVRNGACRVAAWARMAGAPVTPGAVIAVRGSSRILERGMRIDAARVDAQAGSAWLIAWRGRIGARIDQRFGARAPLVRALLIADQRALDATLRAQYADAGLVHLLSVSGLHVAIIATALLTLGGMLRLPASALESSALLLVIGYVILLGAPAPAVRSAVMLVVTALAKRWQRPVHAWTALALGAVLPTFADPLIIADLGWQLSVAGMAALVGAGALQRRWRRWAHVGAGADSGWRRPVRKLWQLRGWRAQMVGELTTGTIAVLATAPIIAWHFGRLSLIAPLSNVLASPVVAVLQPTLFLVTLLEPVNAIAQFLADATQPMMALLDTLATRLGTLPHAVVHVAPERGVVILVGGAVLLILRATRAASMRPWLLGAAAVGMAALWWPVLPAGSGTFEVHVLDVGQGDAIAMRTPRGRWILIDAGPRWDGGDAARRQIVPWVRQRGGEVALFVLTHPHEDHVGGAPTVLQALAPRVWWEAAFVGTSRSYREALEQIAAQGIPWRRVAPGDRYRLDGVQVEILAPSPAWVARQENANEASVVLMVTYGAHRFLFTGDAEGGEETWLIEQVTSLRADVLKVGHHGSRTSTSISFLDRVQPRVAVVSVGAGNRYGHPAPVTQYRLLRHDVPMFRTDLDGAITFRSDGRVLTAENDGEQWIVPERERVRGNR